MLYHVREIGYNSVIPFQARAVDFNKDVRIAYIRHDRTHDAMIITCWEEPNVVLENPFDPNTKATLSMSPPLPRIETKEVSL